MTKDEAHRLLDEAKAGRDVPTDWIVAALIATGDKCASGLFERASDINGIAA